MSTMTSGQVDGVSAQDLLDAFSTIRDAFSEFNMRGMVSDSSVFSRQAMREIASAATVTITNDGAGGSFRITIQDGPNGGSSFQLNDSTIGASVLSLLGVDLCPPDANHPPEPPTDLLQGLPGFNDPSGGSSGLDAGLAQFFLDAAFFGQYTGPTVTVYPASSGGSAHNFDSYDYSLF